jgi:hypothetical protein
VVAIDSNISPINNQAGLDAYQARVRKALQEAADNDPRGPMISSLQKKILAEIGIDIGERGIGICFPWFHVPMWCSFGKKKGCAAVQRGLKMACLKLLNLLQHNPASIEVLHFHSKKIWCVCIQKKNIFTISGSSGGGPCCA